MERILATLAAIVRVTVARIQTPLTWKQVAVDEAQQLGGIYIKFLQMVASHESTRAYLTNVSYDMAYEHVAYEDIHVHQMLGKIESEHFSYVAEQPFAAGSYGQVYHGQLKSGQQVIIKILRPSLAQHLMTDIRFLSLITRCIRWVTPRASADVYAVFREFARTTLAETDYIREARGGEWLREYFKRTPAIVIPQTYITMSTKQVLVQQHVAGISLAQVMDEQAAGMNIQERVRAVVGSDVWQQLATLGSELLGATLLADQLMVDPHPGNIRLLPHNQVALIDFGMMATAPTNRSAFADIISEYVALFEHRFDSGSLAIAMLAFYDNELYRALKVVARNQSYDFSNMLGSFVRQQLIQEVHDRTVQHFIDEQRVTALFRNVVNTGNRMAIKLDESNILVQRSMNMYLSTIRLISEQHPTPVFQPIVHSAVRTVYDNVISRGLINWGEVTMNEEQAYEVVTNWLASVAERDRSLYQYLIQRSYA